MKIRVLHDGVPAVKSELQRTNDPAPVFYTTSSGNYAEERSGVPDEAMEHAMMIGATNRLVNNYCVRIEHLGYGFFHKLHYYNI